jgi:GTP-binding protein
MSFRREAHVPMGGPDGGDGGRGADVVLVCDDSLRDLQSFKRSAHYKAGRGRHGEGNQRHGADGERFEVRVPPGTEVHKWDGTVYDLVRPGQRVTVAAGGSGGRGNRKFKSSTRQSPRFAEKGLEGRGGLARPAPQAPRRRRARRRPQRGQVVADLRGHAAPHPRSPTTPSRRSSPSSGTLDGGDRQLILADIPGLIEGASDGRRASATSSSRTSSAPGCSSTSSSSRPWTARTPSENHAVIERELAKHDKRLARLPRILVLSKADLVPPEASRRPGRAGRRASTPPLPASRSGRPRPADRVPVIVTSSATGSGSTSSRPSSCAACRCSASRSRGARGGADLAEHRVFRPRQGKGWQIEQLEDGLFRVSGEQVETLLARHDLENEDALAHVEHRLAAWGVLRALEAEGFEPGDDVEIAGIVFELTEGPALVRVGRRMARLVVKLGSSVVARDDGRAARRGARARSATSSRRATVPATS